MLESRGPSWWESKVSAGVRRWASIVIALAVGAALSAFGAAELRQALADHRQAQLVSLAVSLDVWASSPSAISPGEVVYYLAIRNGGTQPLEVTSIRGFDLGLSLRSRDDATRQVDPGQEILVPLSALLTCTRAAGAPDVAPGPRIVLGLRRDGATLTPLRESLDGAGPLLDAARTLCAVRPKLRSYELSGPVVRPAAADPTED